LYMRYKRLDTLTTNHVTRRPSVQVCVCVSLVAPSSIPLPLSNTPHPAELCLTKTLIMAGQLHMAGLDLFADDDARWAYAAALRKTVTVLQYAYPIFMLVFFLAAFTTRSIAASNSNANIAKPTTTGPGGKPLPATDPTRNFVKRPVHDDVTHTQKRVFEWVSFATALTFIGNSVLVIAHSLVMKKEHWWAGKSVVVCTAQKHRKHRKTNTAPDLPRGLLLRLLPVPHLTGRFEALANGGSSGDLGRRNCPRSHPGGPVLCHLHACTQGANRRPPQYEAALPHD
jgi:hypothetical protein